MWDKLKEECGVFGIINHEEAANMAYLGLYALQHRGQESAGITSNDGNQFHILKRMGLVADIFDAENLASLEGNSAIGHVRYSTTGDSRASNAQPLLITCRHGEIALAHNGNLINADALRKELQQKGSIFNSDNDSEVILHLIARSRASSFEEAIIDALRQVQGAYSLLFLIQDKVIAVRDPRGIRPLAMGTLTTKDDYNAKSTATVFSSETCAFDIFDGTFEREVAPGEMVVVDKEGSVESHFPFEKQQPRQCVFEHIYFARPDGIMFGECTQNFRDRIGIRLAVEAPVAADLVVPVPDSGMFAALGFSKASGIPFSFGLIRNHYVGRTFIEPKQSIRHFGVKIKLNPIKDTIKGKRVVLVDDSLVRGTTSRKIVKMVRKAGATEVHVRISAPPTAYPCFYGIDTPTRSELVASSHSLEEIRKYIGADSLAYISLQGLFNCLQNSKKEHYCHACFSGDYPILFNSGKAKKGEAV
ncbi:MAG: amidophosphoribosyltransferase [Acidobacteria bacterium]|nr:MAG: amidophosphoribosyltransferase [Acidobacteriota bacterium]